MSKNTSKRAKAVGLADKAEFQAAVDRIAQIQTEMRQIEAARDHQIQLIQEESAELLDELEQELKGKIALAEKFADENRIELFPKDKKSHATALATYGFRTGNRTVVLLNKQCSWDTAVMILKALCIPGAVRVVEEVNKEKILELTDPKGELRWTGPDKNGDIVEQTCALSGIGLRIKQPEAFWIEPKLDGAEKVKGGAS